MHTTASGKADAQERIRRRFRLGLALATLLLVGGSFYYAWHPRAPVYEGKTAAQWFHEYEKAAARYWITPVGNQSIITIGNRLARYPSTFPASNFVVVRVLDEQALRQDQSARALRALGTNAALYLGQQYLREDGRLATNYRKVYAEVPGGLQKFLPEPPTPRSAVRANIGRALEVLDQDATPAVPALLSVLQTRNNVTRYTTLGVLRRLPFDRRLLDPILDNWSRNGDHTNMLLVMADLQVYTHVAAVCLSRAVVEGDLAVRYSSLYQLEKCGPTAVAALSELIAALTDADDETRYLAARVLVAIGPDAAPAIPALFLATTDSSIMVQRASARALLAIRGQSQD
jgi:hypothetical protein